ncbi:DUF421 domain-containing protein [Desulfofalx alkaliphila]|uniref:DUF421 domain-containing protein n=1 Tax=Desulfofalx alkaliphila TaxID=105483 RepID=UPI0004E0BD52|nr:DUF421 domain-containing protein [Desulfofalx alkaliphila]
MSDVLMILLRSLGVFVLALFIIRFLGRRQTSQMTLFDFVTATVIGFIAASLVLKLVPVLPGLAALIVWTILPIFSYLLAFKYKWVRDIIQGKETVLINHGKVLEDKLLEARYTPEDLLSQLRRKNIFQVADVEFAVLEPNGDLSVLLKKDKMPVTPKTLGIEVANQSVPQTVMMDGEIIDEHLTALGLNRNWLLTELEKAAVAPENVFIAQVDSVGQLYLDLFDDALIVPRPKTKELAYANIKKCQADCELYALATKHQGAKKMYSNAAKELAQVVEELKPLLSR